MFYHVFKVGRAALFSDCSESGSKALKPSIFSTVNETFQWRWKVKGSGDSESYSALLLIRRTDTNFVPYLFLSPSSSVSFFSGHSVGVSNAGVIPARVPPPIPPSCRAPLPPPTASNNDRTVHFNLQGSKGKGYIGFMLSDDQSNIFELR